MLASVRYIIVSLVRDVRRDKRGIAIIEMAIVAPVLALITVGMIDLSNGYSKKIQLEQAAQRTIEKAQQTLISSDMRDALRAEAAQTAGVDPNQVTVDSWLECGGKRAVDYDSVCPEGERFARYLNVSIQSSYTPMFAFPFAGAVHGVYPITGSAGVRTQ